MMSLRDFKVPDFKFPKFKMDNIEKIDDLTKEVKNKGKQKGGSSHIVRKRTLPG